VLVTLAFLLGIGSGINVFRQSWIILKGVFNQAPRYGGPDDTLFGKS